MADKNVIELNGKRYDARTGAFLGASHTAVAKPLAPRPSHAGKTIDGFMRPTAAKAQHHAAVAHPVPKPPIRDITRKPIPAGAATHKASVPAHVTAAPKQVVTQRKGKNTVVAHQPEHAKTLMRRSVHKPATTPKPAIKASLPIEIMAAPVGSIAVPRKHSAMQVDSQREARASKTARHGAIKRFNPIVAHPGVATAGMPKHPTISAHRDVPLIAVQPMPHASPLKPQPATNTLTHHTDMFESAINHASSHTQPKHHPRPSRRARLINTFAAVGALLVIAGFIGYLNLPNISLRVASVQAGFRADMPSYHPTGYALNGGIKHTGNTVSMTFTSGENKFTITQQASDWSSETLRDNTLALAGAHKTIQASGRTVFIYDENNATWVDGSKRFDLTGNAPLSTDEIADIAASM